MAVVFQPCPRHLSPGEICCAPAAAAVLLDNTIPDVSVCVVPKELVVTSNLEFGEDAPTPTSLFVPSIKKVPESKLIVSVSATNVVVGTVPEPP